MTVGSSADSSAKRHSLYGLLKVIRKHPTRFAIFVIINLFAALLGVTVTVAVAIWEESLSLSTEFLLTLRAGSLYTFTIAFLVSSASFLYQAQTKTQPDEQIKQWKLMTLVGTFVVVAIIGAAAGIQAHREAMLVPRVAMAYTKSDFFQITAFIFGVVLSFFSFLLVTYEEDVDSFAEESTAKANELATRSVEMDNDGRGMSV